MRMRPGLLALMIAALPAAGLAQDAVQQRMDQFEQRLNELEQRYKQELKARDEEIARLRGELQELRSSSRPTAAPGEEPAPAQPPTQTVRDEILRDIETKRAPPPAERPFASFNPDIAVIGDVLASYSPNRGNDAYNRIDVREIELDLRAPLHPRADGVAVLAFERDVDNPVFPEHEHEDEHGHGHGTSVSIEEAYIFLHDLGIPNLTAKLGRFYLRFGRQNMLHLHNLPTVDPPMVNQAFLSPEALGDAGLSLSYVIPNPWGQYFEVVGEVISGEGSGSHSPTLGGDFTVDSPAFNIHALWNRDITRDLNLELGASWLSGHADSDNRLDVNLFGFDATLMRRDPRGRFNNQLLQSELIYGKVDTEEDGRQHALGAYVLGQQQLTRDWYAGLRLDWTEDPHDASHETWSISPYLSWYWTEFMRFRLQYQHRGGDVPSEDILYFQATFTFGAHPPHPYWVMR